MRHRILLILLSFIFNITIAQEIEEHHFFVNIADASSLIITQNSDESISIWNSKDKKETAIYEKYKIFNFKIAHPSTDRKLSKTVYHIITNSKNLVKELQENYPEKYTRIQEIFPSPNAYYPNDYGNTSPVENLGNKYSSRDLDVINAPGAWGITKGDKKVIIGLSDAPIDTLNSDFEGKIIKNLYGDRKSSNCSHGTNVAGVAFARMDNAYGRPGICGECRGISGRYGIFSHIEDLVEAGAKIINASWAVCSPGPRYEEINQRIKEYYDDGIIIVAAAGNGVDCNRDKNSMGDKMYPASFEKVISVTGVFVENQFIEDAYFTKDSINYTKVLVDRRNGHFTIDESGNLTPTSLHKGVQVNTEIDLVAPREGYLLGNDICNEEVKFGGASSNAAPYVSGTIGLMWSVNYCLSSYEIESILKLTSVDVENLNGNIPFKGMLGAGRLDTYEAVKMANDMKDLNGTIHIKNRNFYRFDFKIERAQNNIVIENQIFRDSSTVDFKARKSIVLKPKTHLKPNASSKIKLAIDPKMILEECEPQPPKKYDRIFN